MVKTVKAWASKDVNSRTLHVVEGSDEFEQGDRVTVRTEDGTVVRATVTSKDVFSFAVSRNTGDGR